MAGYNNWEKFYQRLNMIFHGIIATSLIPFAFVFLETQREFPDGSLVDGSLLIILNAVLIAGSVALIIASEVLKKKKILVQKTSTEIPTILDGYLRKKVVLFAVLEGASFISLVGLYLTKNHVFTGIYLVVLLVFSLQRPTFDRVSKETGIDAGELERWGKVNPGE